MARWSDRGSFACAAAVMLLMAAALGFRAFFASAFMPPPQRMQGEATQAYRYSLMVSRGEPVPAVDPMAMHPGGFHTGQNSIFEEYIAGGLHRVLGGDFNGFMRLFCLAFPLLAMPGVFLWTRAAGFSGRQALTAAALYGMILPALLRARGESLYRETVALPFIVFLGWTLERALNTPSRRLPWAAAAGALLFAGLAAWKVTGFLAAFLFLYLLVSGRVPRDPRLLLPLGAAQVAASVLLAHMRHDAAMFSPASILAVAVMASCIPSSGLRRLLPWLGIVTAISSAVFLPGSGGHVSGVLLAKLRFLFRHPADPLMLSPDARLFWVGGYTSPTPGEFLWLMGPLVILAAPGLTRFLRCARHGLMVSFLAVSFAGYLFFDRLHVFLAVAMVPVIAAAAAGRKALLVLVFLVAGAHSIAAPGFGELLSRAGLPFRPGASLLTDAELDRYIGWARSSTSPDQAFLAYWHISGLTSAYAERPTVLHTFFENRVNRSSIVSFSSALFGTEAEIVRFMEAHRATYLVYQADFTLDLTWQGAAYLGGFTAIPESSAAILLQYHPEALSALVPVWQDNSIRVFRLGGTPVPLERKLLFTRRYAPFLDYGTALASVADPVGTGLSLASQGMAAGLPDAVSAGLLLLSERPGEVPAEASVGLLQYLVQAHLAGVYGISELEGDFEAYLRGWGPDPEVRLDLVRLLERSGLTGRALHHFSIVHSGGGYSDH